MKEINIRLTQVAKHYGLASYAKFAKFTGLSHQTASNYLKGKQKPDIDKLTQIIQSFDDINVEWLITGKGEMLKKSESEPVLSKNIEYLIELQRDKIEYLEKEIQKLKNKQEKNTKVG